MATVKKVQRPSLTLAEKLYLPAIFKGLLVTLGHALRSLRGKTRGRGALESSGLGITMQYPENKWDQRLPDYHRGVPALVTDELGRERCVACQLCEFICPPRAISMKPGALPPDDPWAKVEKAPVEFDIDMIRCIYCGLCEEVCPEQAIFLRPDYSVTGTSRAGMIHDKKMLYEIGGVRVGLVNKWNELK